VFQRAQDQRSRPAVRERERLEEDDPMIRERAPAPAVVAVRRALTRNRVDQETVLSALGKLWSGREVPPERLEHLLHAVGVKTRHLALPVGDYAALDSFPRRNEAWVSVALELGEEAIRRALDAADLGPRDVDHIFFTTVTGIAVPSICARLANRLGFRSDVKRTPLFGLGCVAGAAGTARAADFLRAFPDEIAILLSVELCSLTLQRDDRSVANLIASGLFGDGAAALVLAGGDRTGRAGPRVVASRSILYPDTEDVMGWEIVEGGFKLILSGRVPDMARDHVARDVDSFLASLELDRSAIRHWICHTGGPKVLVALEEALTLPPGALARSWRALEETGNLSSASVLLVLEDLLASGEARPGDRGVMMAMGPGFCCELVLLEW
jgi:alkylresorcinol/alkylpyrone synthase